MNKRGYYYEVVWRLDDLSNYDNTEYFDEINYKKDAIKLANMIKKEFGSRVVMLDICKYNEEELMDVDQII